MTQGNRKEPTYDPAFFAQLRAAEDRHFWFRARNDVLAGLLRRLMASWPAGFRALEVGCGTGNTLRVVERTCRQGLVVGVDLFTEGLAIARTRVSCPLVQADVHRLPFGASFRLIGLFDVLEHLPDDVEVLSQLRRLLLPGGKIVLTVPAHMRLWSHADEAAHHCRRYERATLQGVVERAGYRLNYLTEYMAALYPVLSWARRLANLARPRNSASALERARKQTVRELAIVPVFNEILYRLLTRERSRVSHFREIDRGTSLLAVAEASGSPGTEDQRRQPSATSRPVADRHLEEPRS